MEYVRLELMSREPHEWTASYRSLVILAVTLPLM